MFLSDKYFIVSPDDIIEDMAKKQNITYNEAWKTVNFRDLYKQIQQNVNILFGAPDFEPIAGKTFEDFPIYND